MSCRVEYIPDRELVLIVATGDILDEDGRAQVVETVHLLKQHQSNLVLVDCSEAVTRASLPGLYPLPDYATELGAPWDARIAVVLPRKRFQMEMFHFFELVFRNAGYDIQLFNDRQDAEEWLQKPTSVLTTGANPAVSI
jgi:hypothetical protein